MFLVVGESVIEFLYTGKESVVFMPSLLGERFLL